MRTTRPYMGPSASYKRGPTHVTRPYIDLSASYNKRGPTHVTRPYIGLSASYKRGPTHMTTCVCTGHGRHFKCPVCPVAVVKQHALNAGA